MAGELTALELHMVGVVAGDAAKSQEFYRRLGVAVPEGSAGEPHVEVNMKGGLTFHQRRRPCGDRRRPARGLRVLP